MRFRLLGNTGLQVSILSFGASSLGGVFRDVDQESANRTVATALDRGMNFIDVSPYYGLTKAETALGKALRGVSRDRYILATKVGRYGVDDFDFSRERVVASVDESLARMGVEHIDLIQCHDIEFVGLDQIVDETLPALRELQESGKVRFVGITGLPLKIFRDVIERADVDTILSYCRCSLNDTALTGVLPWLGEKGVGVINASPLSMGLLSDRAPPGWHPAPEEVKQACVTVAAHCRSKGASIAKLAVQFSVSDERVATTLVGSANPDNIARNCEWVDEPIDEGLLAEVREILAPVDGRTWPSGLPENH
jgi:aryl-alcohol dehydrogenase-like predicted oxidoreductase